MTLYLYRIISKREYVNSTQRKRLCVKLPLDYAIQIINYNNYLNSLIKFYKTCDILFS